MAFRSQISAVIANQVGRIQGELEARIQQEAINLLQEFANQCPNQDRLVQIVGVRNNLIQSINDFQKLVNRFSNIASKLTPPIQVARVVINLLKANPTPSAVAGVGVPLGVITTFSNSLRNANLLLESLEDDVNSLNSLLQGVGPSLNNVKQILESVNTNIQDCAEELGNLELIQQIQPLENTGSEGTPNENFTYIGANGRSYTLAIIEDRSLESSIPRRVAVAKDNIGVIILRGQPSFSSNTQVLLDELKFRIDNQLP